MGCGSIPRRGIGFSGATWGCVAAYAFGKYWGAREECETLKAQLAVASGKLRGIVTEIECGRPETVWIVEKAREALAALEGEGKVGKKSTFVCSHDPFEAEGEK